MKKIFFVCSLLAALIINPCISVSSTLIGGDATNQASADDILDIMFLIDTSGSMSDDISAIGSVAQHVVQTLECPNCNVYVRARFMGIAGNSGTVFNENLYSQTYRGSVNDLEDNGWAAAAAASAVSGTWWTNDAATGQDYYRAVVTIGDEGTDNGQPVNQADWDAAYAANQAAISNSVFLFSWVTNDPYAGVVDIFQTMAMGGTGGGYTFGFAGGGSRRKQQIIVGMEPWSKSYAPQAAAEAGRRQFPSHLRCCFLAQALLASPPLDGSRNHN